MSHRSKYFSRAAFASSFMLMLILGEGPDAAAWVRTLHADACTTAQNGAEFRLVSCSFPSDTAMRGGNATGVYVDVFSIYGSTHFDCRACAMSYDGAHYACGIDSASDVASNTHMDIGLATWGSGWSPWDYFSVDCSVNGEVGGVQHPATVWSLQGIGVRGT